MPLVERLAIAGTHPEAEGIEARGTMQMTLSHVHLRGLLHGVHLVGNNRNILIESCHIYENRGIGIFYDDVNLHQIQHRRLPYQLLQRRWYRFQEGQRPQHSYQRLRYRKQHESRYATDRQRLN